MKTTLLWMVGIATALAAATVARCVSWLNRRGLEVIATDVPDHVPAYLVEMYARD